MKIEILIKRLADKTGTPVLEQVLLGEKDIKSLPMGCMIWTGASTGNLPNLFRSKMRRDSNNLPYMDKIKAYPYGIIRWQKKTQYIQRLIFQMITKPDYEFRLISSCGVPLCVNPLHWEVQVINQPELVEIPEMEIETEDWNVDEIEELVEILLDEQSPSSWAEVIAAPLMEEVPHEMLRNVLIEMGMERLTNGSK